MVFFSREGRYLGAKGELLDLLHNIISIPHAALQGEPLTYFATEERLRWAEGRRTKKREDKAYCLLGIFGVHIPLIYGEGDNAFDRLKREIGEQSHTKDSVVMKRLRTSENEQVLSTIPTPMKGACRWIFQQEKYEQWYRCKKNDLLWNAALLGHGKSTMAKFLAEEFRRAFV